MVLKSGPFEGRCRFPMNRRIAVLIPCFNEVRNIAGFSSQLPNAKIHVCDNNSSDGTAAETEPLAAHGNVGVLDER
jgi:glycosyltransferase involved in cell wall biosynthesis